MSVAPYAFGRQEAACPQEGQTVLGGGYGGSAQTGGGEGTTAALTLVGSLPSEDGTKWTVSVLNETSEAFSFAAFAICAAAL